MRIGVGEVIRPLARRTVPERNVDGRQPGKASRNRQRKEGAPRGYGRFNAVEAVHVHRQTLPV